MTISTFGTARPKARPIGRQPEPAQAAPQQSNATVPDVDDDDVDVVGFPAKPPPRSVQSIMAECDARLRWVQERRDQLLREIDELDQERKQLSKVTRHAGGRGGAEPTVGRALALRKANDSSVMDALRAGHGKVAAIVAHTGLAPNEVRRSLFRMRSTLLVEMRGKTQQATWHLTKAAGAKA